MKTEMKKVRTGGNIVSEIEVPIYENVDEIAENEDAGRILAMFNNANVIRLMGNERAKFQPQRAGKQRRFELGYNVLTADEAMSVTGDIQALKELIESDEIQERIDAKLAEE